MDNKIEKTHLDNGVLDLMVALRPIKEYQMIESIKQHCGIKARKEHCLEEENMMGS